MPYRRGDVVLVLFPDSNLRTAKRRPAPVIQRENLDSGLHQTIVAMITSNMARTGHPSRIMIPLIDPVARECGFKTDSVLMTDNLATVREVEIDRTIGFWPNLEEVNAALRHTLQL